MLSIEITIENKKIVVRLVDNDEQGEYLVSESSISLEEIKREIE